MKVKVTVVNGETPSYTVYLSYLINSVHSEPSFASNGQQTEFTVTIGTGLGPGTQIRYDGVVASSILKAWVKCGWKTVILQ